MWLGDCRHQDSPEAQRSLDGDALKLPRGEEYKWNCSPLFPKSEFLIHLKGGLRVCILSLLMPVTDSLIWFLSFNSHIPKKRVIASISQGCWQELKECVGKGHGNSEVRRAKALLDSWVCFSASFWSSCSPPSAEVNLPWVDR